MRTRILLVATAILTLVTTLATANAASATTTAHSRQLAAMPKSLTFSFGCFSTTRPIDCVISEPIVNQPQATYFLSFRPGDQVLVLAGGCVQTGGKGKTWKRYVDPASDNDLYHGLITIPTATGVLDRLVNVVGRPLFVTGSGNLVLGYQDDAYSDNGYYARNNDNGTGNQCLGLGNAFVRIIIS